MKSYRLGEICDLKSGGTPRRGTLGFYGGEIPWVKIRDFDKSKDGVVFETEETITAQGLQGINGRLFPPGTLLLAMYGSVGKLAIAGVTLSTNQAILGIQPKEEGVVDIKFLKHWFEKNQGKIIGRARGGTLQNISADIVKKLIIPLPPFSQQQHLAYLLDRADALRRKRQEALALLDELGRSVFLEMFGKNAEGYEEWETVNLETLALSKKGSMRTGPFGSNLKHEEFSETGDVVVLGIDNAVQNSFAWGKKRFISFEKYEELKSYRVYPRDVIITIMGTLGRAAVLPDDLPISINTKHLAAITLNEKKANPYFLAYSIYSHPLILSQLSLRSRGAIMEGLNLTIIKELKIKRPPIDKQNKFEQILKAIQTTKSKAAEHLQEAEMLFQSLLHRAMQGEAEVKEEVYLEMVVRDRIYQSMGHKWVEGNLSKTSKKSSEADFIFQKTTGEIDRIFELKSSKEMSFNLLLLDNVFNLNKRKFTFEELASAAAKERKNLAYEDLKKMVFDFIESGKFIQEFSLNYHRETNTDGEESGIVFQIPNFQPAS